MRVLATAVTAALVASLSAADGPGDEDGVAVPSCAGIVAGYNPLTATVDLQRLPVPAAAGCCGAA